MENRRIISPTIAARTHRAPSIPADPDVTTKRIDALVASMYQKRQLANDEALTALRQFAGNEHAEVWMKFIMVDRAITARRYTNIVHGLEADDGLE